jgi:hypothetical protein
MDWLITQFGKDTLLRATPIEPLEKFFPDPYDATEPAIRLMLNRICAFMHIHPDRVELQLYEEQRTAAGPKLLDGTTSNGSAGHYRVDGKEIIGLEKSNLHDPLAVVATLAHELAHVRLLGEQRLSPDEPDHEPLTDLTTVFFGLGIFNANSTFRFNQWSRGNRYGWKASTLGYLNEEMFGYALALWTTLRNDLTPTWPKHLRTNPRTYMKQSLRYLSANPFAENLKP